ncbi:MAG: vWA domain-containing protein [Burkholderiales bacterium]
MQASNAPLPGMLTANVMHFARVLRHAGLPIGSGKIIDAVEAVRAVGVVDRDDFFWALHAVFVNRTDQRELFQQAFRLFWCNPKSPQPIAELIDFALRIPGTPAELNRRVADAMYGHRHVPKGEILVPPKLEIDAALTWSEREVLRDKDFEAMSTEELRCAEAVVRAMRLPKRELPTRRFKTDPHGKRIDMPATLRATLRSGCGMIDLVRKKRSERAPPLVLLCDVSGSMSRYAKMLLHFAHALSTQRDRVHCFVFGTRLTNISRDLRQKEVDAALKAVSRTVQDWSGGTRIGQCLHEFNRIWSRRVSAQGAIVLFVSDGLDRGESELLGHEAARLHRSCRRLVWLNPLLRYQGFEPKSMGIKTLLPHVDDFRAVHNLDSLDKLVEALDQGPVRSSRGLPLIHRLQ